MNDVVAFRPPSYLGMYDEDGRIVVDVKRGEKQIVYEFMMRRCAGLFSKHRLFVHDVIKFVEQKSLPKFSGRRGDGLGFLTDDEIAHKIRTSPEIRSVTCAWRKFEGKVNRGTLACFARQQNEPTKQMFIITARHVFEAEDGDVSVSGTKHGNYFSDQSSADSTGSEELTHVATESRGILGLYEHISMGRVARSTTVDIALIPINEAADGVDVSSSNIPNLYEGNMRQLKNAYVEKIGLITPHTRGRILHGNYSGQYAGINARHVILVKAEAPFTEFAMQGDSGSLVVQLDPNSDDRTVRTAIGIIHKRWENWTNSSNVEHDVTVVLPLKNCFDAVEEEFGVKLQLCAKWEDCRIQPFRA